MPPASSPKPYEDYNVAIVCTMDSEFSAVRYMLDKEHLRLPIQWDDPNAYVLGDLNGHNVVIACAFGRQAQGLVTVNEYNLARLFPSIRLVCLVGSGGGVFEKPDVRLGDVVVSMPWKECWPLSKQLKSAVEAMQSDCLIADNKIDQHLHSMVSKSPGLAIYDRPSADSDIHFDKDYPHPPGSASHSGCDQSKTVDRPCRERSKTHYGLITLGDITFKSVVSGREGAQSMGTVLCFEMEAASLTTLYPCVVIRGVSDFADSHRNKEWRNFAAAAAAAGAKELLSYIDPSSTAF